MNDITTNVTWHSVWAFYVIFHSIIPYNWIWQLDMFFVCFYATVTTKTKKMPWGLRHQILSEAITRFEFEHLCYVISILVMLNFVIGWLLCWWYMGMCLRLQIFTLIMSRNGACHDAIITMEQQRKRCFFCPVSSHVYCEYTYLTIYTFIHRYLYIHILSWIISYLYI